MTKLVKKFDWKDGRNGDGAVSSFNGDKNFWKEC